MDDSWNITMTAMIWPFTGTPIDLATPIVVRTAARPTELVGLAAPLCPTEQAAAASAAAGLGLPSAARRASHRPRTASARARTIINRSLDPCRSTPCADHPHSPIALRRPKEFCYNVLTGSLACSNDCGP